MKTKPYLCGPINGCTDAECNDWRSEVKKHFPKAIDPMRRDYRGQEDDFVAEIVEGDKFDILDSDYMIANCPKPSVGTSMEIFYAWQKKIGVVAIVPDITTASPWLKYHCRLLVTTVAEAIQWVKAGG